MKKILKHISKGILIVLIINLVSSKIAFSQTAGYVRSDNPVYDYLTKLDALGFLENYNSFERPLPEDVIAKYLKEAIQHESELNEVDKKTLEDFKVEFELELSDSLSKSQSLIGHQPYDLFSQNERYLYYKNDKDVGNIFVNLIAEGEPLALCSDTTGSSHSYKSFLGLIGGEIKGTILNHYGFDLLGTDGNIFGDKEAALFKRELQYNWKLKDNHDNSFYDETEGYFTADYDLIKLKIGRDRQLIGYGNIKSILGDNSPMFDYVSLRLNYDFFNFSFFFGKILGTQGVIIDSITGNVNTIEEKYLAYHRVNLDISKDFTFGAGELIIYSDRGIDLSYLNPFSFYKTIEHYNADRDNAMLFFDASYNVMNGLKLYGTLLIDDIDFGKIGTGWYGDQTLWNFRVTSYNLYKIIPVDISVEYLRIEPYVYTHRLIGSNYTNLGYNLSSNINPNSELFFGKINYSFTNRISFAIEYSYIIHGANPTDKNGNVIQNVGGDINLGYRTFDATTVHFLNGVREYLRNFAISGSYEPFKNYIISVKVINENDSLQNNVLINDWFFDLLISVKI
jgi:hypothetical protein